MGAEHRAMRAQRVAAGADAERKHAAEATRVDTTAADGSADMDDDEACIEWCSVCKSQK